MGIGKGVTSSSAHWVNGYFIDILIEIDACLPQAGRIVVQGDLSKAIY